MKTADTAVNAAETKAQGDVAGKGLSDKSKGGSNTTTDGTRPEQSSAGAPGPPSRSSTAAGRPRTARTVTSTASTESRTINSNVRQPKPRTPSQSLWLRLFGDEYLRLLLLLTGFVVAVQAMGIVVGMQMERYEACLEGGLPQGGKTIGMLERAIIFLLVLAGKPEGVGFLAAAKSVFRIGELKDASQRKQAEYIMIGTLASFTYAMLVQTS